MTSKYVKLVEQTISEGVGYNALKDFDDKMKQHLQKQKEAIKSSKVKTKKILDILKKEGVTVGKLGINRNDSSPEIMIYVDEDTIKDKKYIEAKIKKVGYIDAMNTVGGDVPFKNTYNIRFK
jgi:hypothetical protein